MSLANDDSDGEQNDIRVLQMQLESTNRLVKELSLQLSELKDQVLYLYTNYSECLHPLTLLSSAF